MRLDLCLTGLPSVGHSPIWTPFTAADERGPRGAGQCAHLSSLHAEPERGGSEVAVENNGPCEMPTGPCEMPTGPNEEAEQRAAVVSGAVETGAGAGGAESRGEDGELLRSVTSSQCGRVLEHKTTSDCEDQSDASRRGSSRGTC